MIASSKVGEPHVFGQPRGWHEPLVKDKPVDKVGGAARLVRGRVRVKVSPRAERATPTPTPKGLG
eukprot:scaffold88936_cov44-Phaeocystis_antarctica.AAC.2